MLILPLLLLISCSARAASVRGHELVFNVTKPHARSLAASTSLWYVKSGSIPPPGCVAHEAVAPGVYLARGDASLAYPRGRWTPEMKYDAKMSTKSLPKFPDFGVQIRTDESFIEFAECVSTPAGRGRFYVGCKTNKLAELSKDDRVLWISEIPHIKMHSYESRLLMMGSTNYNGSGTRIAVSDTGLDYKHCAFYEGSNPPLGSVNSARAKVVGIIKASGGDYIALTGAHGTMTAGVAAGYACSYRSETGVAPQSKVWFLDASDDDDYLYIPSNLETLVANSGASVHSASWGSYTGGEYNDMASRWDSMARANPTVCPVQSAGNDGPDGVVGATQKGGLIVAACLSRAAAFANLDSNQRTHQPELFAHTSQIDFSSRGPSADGRLIPQVCAPGFQVWVPYALYPSTSDHTDYVRADGTSFSAPAIAGLIANLQQKWKLEHAGAYPTCALMEATLMAHAVKPTRVVRRVGSRLEVVDNAPAITTLGTPIIDFARMTQVDGLSVTSTGRVAVCFENTDTEPWSIYMRWTDVAAAPGADNPLINDLDMVVVGSMGTVLVVDDAINSFERVQSWPAQHTRLIISAFQGVSTFGAQPFAVSIKGKAVRVDCASTILPSEYTNCTHGSVSVDSWRGTSSCDFQLCPANTCGADCARTCDVSKPCVPTLGGSGVYDESEQCRPAACPPYTFVTDTECKCKLGTARPCSNGQMASCRSDGTFGLCPAGSESSEGVQDSGASELGAAIPWLILACLVLTA